MYTDYNFKPITSVGIFDLAVKYQITLSQGENFQNHSGRKGKEEKNEKGKREIEMA